MNSCLQIKVTKAAANMQAVISQLCTVAELKFLPLLVDEGYLLVDFNGTKTYIYVDKNKEDAKRILS